MRRLLLPLIAAAVCLAHIRIPGPGAGTPWRIAVPSSLAGPTGCTTPSGYVDPATCTPGTDGFTVAPGTTFTDYTHGGAVTILTTAGNVHDYSTPIPISNTAKYLLTANLTNGTHSIWNVATQALVHSVFAYNNAWWDPNDDEKLYWMDATKLFRHDVLLNTDTVLIDYTGTYANIKRGGTGDSSKDNWIPFWDPDVTKVCAVDVAHLATYCVNYSGDNPPGGIDYVLIAKGVDVVSGKRYVIVVGGPANLVYSVNVGANRLDFEFRGPLLPDGSGRRWFSSHADTFEDSAGIQYLVQNDYMNTESGTFRTMTFRLNKGILLADPETSGGGRRDVFIAGIAGQFPSDDYVSCAKKSAYCALYFIGGAVPSGTTPTPGPHTNDVILMQGNGDAITRITQDHTIRYSGLGDNFDYYAFAKPSVSNDGSKIVFTSNFRQHTNLPVDSIVSTGAH
jgi:hypothetical protein